MSNSLDPDFVKPDLGPNCLQRLSAETLKVVVKQTKSLFHCNHRTDPKNIRI